MTQPILERLRAATKSAHAQLEERVQIEARLIDPQRYGELLEDFLGWYEPLENGMRTLAGWSDYGLDLAARRKTPWLAHDLNALGYSEAQIAALPRCRDLPTMETLACGFGCAYVMEGATLGGRHISGLLRESPVPKEARTFFGSYGPSVGERWKEFVAALEAFSDRGGYGDQVVDAARQTFESMESWICRMKRINA
ncbi:MAG: hypothetical protein JWL90_3686 [Chthoniobacteraceae bacterium]|nr:hypothetical protein [Chthoniobacteraceae bacterium]